VLGVFVLSHPHTDHVGGAATVLDALHPREFIDGAFPGPAHPYRNALHAAERDGTRWVRARPGDSLVVDGVTLTILAPDSAWTATLADPNLASVVVGVRVGSVRMLLTGDAEAAEERWMLANDGADALSADVLKVGHHGSRTSTTPEFLAAVAPRVAIISVGAGNHYGLPDEPVLAALELSGARVLRTDRDGTVVVRTDGHTVWVDTERDE
jgi:competence protein ComEC